MTNRYPPLYFYASGVILEAPGGGPELLPKYQALRLRPQGSNLVGGATVLTVVLMRTWLCECPAPANMHKKALAITERDEYFGEALGRGLFERAFLQ